MDINVLQSEIKLLLDLLGWSQKKLARELYMEDCDHDDEVELKRYQERIKKALYRPTTKTDLLRGYLNFIRNHHEFSKKRLVLNSFYPSKNLTDEALDAMKEFSNLVDKKLS